ncbi:hypothetical protein CS063_12875 [Sporanaerobium hydrogeniformans]|uniref:Uncharacterized protein n=1 Tax=Sporanaerobium hydrogeniformans TaxID=3072179 RepID=A0AC61DAI8_9FIRM|nr:flagellin [Sporanaerobium hydrogeniformans]PHV70032.1 hypothetical protein CS063_12875 [Sporanaerobium hydrogeniformans]
MKINYNIPALRTLNSLNKANDSASKVMERLSSGLRINSAGDDAAGMAISQKMNAQVKGLQQANRNVMDGISMIQTAEGACNEVHAMLQRARELTLQAANGTNDDKDRQTISDEVNSLLEEIAAIQQRTEFNKKSLLNGSQDKITLQVGANEKQCLSIGGDGMSLSNVLVNISGVTSNKLPGAKEYTTTDVTGEVTTKYEVNKENASGEFEDITTITDTSTTPEKVMTTTVNRTLGTITYTEEQPTGTLSKKTVTSYNGTDDKWEMQEIDPTDGTTPIGAPIDADIEELPKAPVIQQLGETGLTNNMIVVDGKEIDPSKLPITLSEGSVVSIKLDPGCTIKLQAEEDGTPRSVTLEKGEKLVYKAGKGPITLTANGIIMKPNSDGKQDAVMLIPGTNEGSKYNENLILFGNQKESDATIVRLDVAIEANSKIRSTLGAYQNRLEHTTSNLSVSEENMTAALSRIQDADMAQEMTEYTKYNIISQAGISMLAQANQRPQQILSLLQQ